MHLSPKALEKLKVAYRYTETMMELLQLSKNRHDDTFKHAMLFCLKMLGESVSSASKINGLKIYPPKTPIKSDTMPIFWRNMHYLRNYLIHNYHVFVFENSHRSKMNGNKYFSAIYSKLHQLQSYLKLCIEQKETDPKVDFKKYRIFLDFQALYKQLQKCDPKEYPTYFHLESIVLAIDQIHEIIGNEIIISQKVDDLFRNNLTAYYAVQNNLEIIASIGVAGGEHQLIDKKAFNKWRKDDENSFEDLHIICMARAQGVHGNYSFAILDMVNFINSSHTIRQYLSEKLIPFADTELPISTSYDSVEKEKNESDIQTAKAPVQS